MIRPKALVEINGRTLLEITLARLRQFGVREVIVNVHHFAGMVVEYLAARRNFGMRIEISREDALLDTGGGLKKAAWFFLEDGIDEPFLLHNVDVISDIDLERMIAVSPLARGAGDAGGAATYSSSRQLFSTMRVCCADGGSRKKDARSLARQRGDSASAGLLRDPRDLSSVAQ